MRSLLIVFILFTVTFYCFSQKDEIELYEKKFNSINSEYYKSKYLERVNYFFGGIKSIGIIVSREIDKQTISFYFDSLKYFYRNGELKNIQCDDSIGNPIFSKFFDIKGRLILECNYNYKDSIPFLLNKESSNFLECYIKKYKNGKIIEEGKFINNRKEGLHLFYNENGVMVKKETYIRGKLQ
jgi:antitoxin component YwqK of YwqJK toxin-antitoxin module